MCELKVRDTVSDDARAVIRSVKADSLGLCATVASISTSTAPLSAVNPTFRTPVGGISESRPVTFSEVNPSGLQLTI